MVSHFSTCLWFDTEAEEAAEHYSTIFKCYKAGNKSHYTDAGKDVHGKQSGSVLTVEFEIFGQKFVGLNGGPHFKPSPAVSFQIHCETQEMIDFYWDKLGDGGDESKQRCGWLTDKFGISWQIVPSALKDLMGSDDKEASQRAAKAMFGMKKLVIADLQAAFDKKE